MHEEKNSVLLLSMPFANTAIPSIQIGVLESYLKENNVDVCSKNLYLKSADFYGTENYNYLTNKKESHSAQIGFSKYVFPKNWEKNQNRIEKYFNEKITCGSCDKKFTFQYYMERTDLFIEWILKNIRWKDIDLIGFTVNYGQFLPSLAVAKKIKKRYPEKKIILGGSRTSGKLGFKTLKYFDYIDYIASGEGEKTLAELAENSKKIESIPNLIYRKKDQIVWNKKNELVKLNDLPYIDFSSFFNDLKNSSTGVKKYFLLHGRIPIEISRGCWWNRCNFCNLNIQNPKYREKTNDKIIEEINTYSEKYKTLNFQIIGNTLPLSKKKYRELFKRIIKLNKDLTFYAEVRSGRFTSKDYYLMKKAGFTNIQTGIESFSQNFLDKMNKGTHVIDNIAALKFCRENNIKNHYNIITDWPNEEKKDFQQTKENIEKIKHYINPPVRNRLMLGYKSPIYKKLDEFNIKNVGFFDIDKLMFPEDFLEKKLCFYYTFEKKEDTSKNNWSLLIKKWEKTREKYKKDSVKRESLFDRYIFFYIDGKSFIKIFDKKTSDKIKMYILDEIEREIFLYCNEKKSYDQIKKHMSFIGEEKIKSILQNFEKKDIMFRQNDFYLSLPLKIKDRPKKSGISKDDLKSLNKFE
ncbi:MAG: RiPP maturation radical SAM C-methyltransferase [Candidatus Thermoplasmatota archaeon]